LQPLIEKSRETGMEIDTFSGDTAYSEKDNIQYANQNELELVSKLHPQISQGNRKAGHMAIRKARQGKKNVGKNQINTYFFDISEFKQKT
jgi:hypothetical protein